MAKNVAVIFGGRTAEHEVSVITAHQAMDALAAGGHEILPIYVTKDGTWLHDPAFFGIELFRDSAALGNAKAAAARVVVRTGTKTGGLYAEKKAGLLGGKVLEELPVDVVLPAIHGSFGEDGALQGLLEWADLPYIGCDVEASAVGMNKMATKKLCQEHGIPVLPGVLVDRRFFDDREAAMTRAVEQLGEFPIMTKPRNLGSSIGVCRCDSKDDLESALELALELDEVALLEPALIDFYEINCAVLGPPAKASVCERPTTGSALLSFEEKYLRGAKDGKGGIGPKGSLGRSTKGKGSTGVEGEGMASFDREVPARIGDGRTALIRGLAVQAFEALCARGVTRVDFLVDKSTDSVYLNEVNTIPGSFSFYLWEESGLPFDALMDELIQIADTRYRARKATTFSFQNALLE
ncbi:MAG: D-alanine--D-alanine ligase family protein, partial [Thermoanaerobaculia bacterium]